MILRQYQISAVQKLRDKVRDGRRLVVLIAPTGSGKTVMAAEIIRAAVARGSRCLFLAHRRELIDQSLDKLKRFGVEAGVIMGNDKRTDRWLPVQVASVQTLIRRDLPTAQIVVVDECHHALSDSYKKIINAYPDAIILGLTATPWRLDKLGLADVFEDFVVAATVPELMATGDLVPHDCFAYDSPDLHDVNTVAGEFNTKELGLACNTKILVGSIIKEYITHANGRRALLFPVDINHSQTLIEGFKAAGVKAEHLDYKTEKSSREKLVKQFNAGEITVLSSVSVLAEGFDAPAAEVCILARPTKSLSMHLQMIGRVLRPSAETGKSHALIHDHSGNLLRHGLPSEDRDYSLNATPSRTKALMTCPKCNYVGRPEKDGLCKCCGFLMQPPKDEPAVEGKTKKEKVCVDGTRLSAEEITEIRARGIRSDLTPKQIQRAKDATIEEKAAEYKRLLAVAEKKGFKKGFAAHKYRETFSVWPKFSEDILANTVAATRPFFELPRTERKQPPRQEPLPFIKKKDKYEVAADLLGVTVSATENDIRTAYRAKVKAELERNGFGDQGDAVDTTIAINSAKSLLIERAKKVAAR
jgi:DNA repair protein RadD